MTKTKLTNSKKNFKFLILPFLSFIALLTLILIILFIKQLIILNQEISLFISGKNLISLNKVPIISSLSDNQAVIVNGFKEEKIFSLLDYQQNLDDLSFVSSSDGSNFAYIVRDNNLETLFVNGEKKISNEKISFISFSPDGKRLAYGIKFNNKDQVILDDQAGKSYDWIFAPYYFTPDGRYFIYKARTDQGDVIVFNNIESQAYDKIYQLVLTPDKKYLMFYARSGSELWKVTLNLEDLATK